MVSFEMVEDTRVFVKPTNLWKTNGQLCHTRIYLCKICNLASGDDQIYQIYIYYIYNLQYLTARSLQRGDNYRFYFRFGCYISLRRRNYKEIISDLSDLCQGEITTDPYQGRRHIPL